MSLIQVKKVQKVYASESAETRALDGVSFEIKKGEFVAIMGPSGSGKSTLLHILGFLDECTGGEYLFEDRTWRSYAKDEVAAIRNTRMGFIFQAFNLLPRTTVLENVKLPLLYSAIPEKEWDALAHKAIESVGMSHRLLHEPSQLSGGEKQRVAIARALVMNPSVIFADEPTGNLDSKSGKMVMETIQNLNEQFGHTVILTTPETTTAEPAHRLIRLKDGLVESDQKIAHQRRVTDGYEK